MNIRSLYLTSNIILFGLVDVQAFGGDFLQHLAVFTRIHNAQIADAFTYPHHLAIGIAGRAFPVVDQQNFFSVLWVHRYGLAGNVDVSKHVL